MVSVFGMTALSAGASLGATVTGGGTYTAGQTITLTAVPNGNATMPYNYQWYSLGSSGPMNPDPVTWNLMPSTGYNTQTISVPSTPGYYWFQALVTSTPTYTTGYYSNVRINVSQTIGNTDVFSVTLDDLGQPDSQGVSPATFTCYTYGKDAGTFTLYPGQSVMCQMAPPINFTNATSVVAGAGVQLTVLNTTDGLYAYQKYADISFETPMVAAAGTSVVVQSATTNSTPNPYNYTFTGAWSGQSTTLHWVPNHTIEGDQGAQLVGTITNFQTGDPYYACLNGEDINVWTDPSYPGVDVVHNGDMGAQCTYLTLTFTAPTSNSSNPNPYNYTFSGTYSGQSVVFHWVPNHTIEGDQGAQLVGTITNFQTADPKYTCLNGESINVWTDPNYPGVDVVHNGDMGTQCTYLTLTFTAPASNSSGTNPYNYTFSGAYNGQAIVFHWVPNHTIEGDQGAQLVGTITNFQTGDPYYACLNGEDINVWTDPSYPGVDVVHNGDMGAQCTYLTLTFTAPTSNSSNPNPYNYTFSGTYSGQSVVFHWVPNHTIEGDQGAQLVGTITNFQTADPKYTCLNGESINVWTDPNYPGVDVVHNGDMGTQCTYLTLTFTASNSTSNPNPYNYTFTGAYNGQAIVFHWVPNHTIEGLSDAKLVGTITDFQTTDPKYTCLNGENINVWSAPSEYPGDYVVHNGDMGPQCTYLTLTFPTTGGTGNGFGSNPGTSSANYTSCNNFVVATTAQSYYGEHTAATGMCTWNGGVLNIYYGSGDSGAVNFTITGSDGVTYAELYPYSTTWCNSYYGATYLPAGTFTVKEVVGRGGGACGAAFVELNGSTSTTGSPPQVTIYPQIQVITLGESAVLLSSVTEGTPPYTYSWNEEYPGSGYFTAIQGATSSTYTFTPYQTGAYNFDLSVIDSDVMTDTSTPVQIIVVKQYEPIEINVTQENTYLNLTGSSPVTLNLKKENATVAITSHENNSHTSLAVTNVTASTPPAPSGGTKLVSLNVSTPATNLTINFTMHYNCNLPSSRVSPYILNNGEWQRIDNYTVDSSACTVTFHLNKDPVVALIENNSTATSAANQTAASKTPSASVLSSALVDVVVVVIVVAAVLIGLAVMLSRKGKGGAQQAARSRQ